VGQTIKSVVSAIAAAHGLKVVIHPALQSKIIPALGFDDKSDAALLRELGTRFDATATVKNKSLLFSPIGQSQSAKGSELSLKTIDRSMTEVRYDYQSASRDTYTGVEAQWHNKSTAQKMAVVAGSSENAKRLKKTYASEASALSAAEAEFKRIRRAKASMNITLVYGRPDLFPDHPLTLTGFKSVINQTPWLVSEATHSLDASGGLSTALVLETRT
jgi:phage protein D